MDSKVVAANLLERFSPRQFVVGGLISLAIVVGGGWWLMRKHEESAMRKVLQQEAPIVSPPVALQFPARVLDTEKAWRILTPGTSTGFWVIQKGRRGETRILQPLLTSQGQRYFSSVGGEIVSVFRAGTREIKQAEKISDAGSTRRLAFRYVWASIHPAMAIFGEEIPEVGREYRGEAILVRNAKGWSVAHWTTPELDSALEKFKGFTE